MGPQLAPARTRSPAPSEWKCSARAGAAQGRTIACGLATERLLPGPAGPLTLGAWGGARRRPARGDEPSPRIMDGARRQVTPVDALSPDEGDGVGARMCTVPAREARRVSRWEVIPRLRRHSPGGHPGRKRPRNVTPSENLLAEVRSVQLIARCAEF